MPDQKQGLIYYGTRDTGHGTRDTGHGTRDTETLGNYRINFA